MTRKAAPKLSKTGAPKDQTMALSPMRAPPAAGRAMRSALTGISSGNPVGYAKGGLVDKGKGRK